MSIDIDWETLTTGPEGLALANSIKDFIHDKFQQVELPRFIRSVHVHSFDFGKECPVVELKDICDPLPEFYEHDEEEEEEEEEEEVEEGIEGDDGDMHLPETFPKTTISSSSATRHPTIPHVDPRPAGLRLNLGFADHIATPPSLPRSSTPGMPGGTSNLSYFHLPLSAGLSGTQTPLGAAVARGTSFPAGWDHHGSSAFNSHPSPHQREHVHPDPSSRPPTATTDAHSREPSKYQNQTPSDDNTQPTPSPTDAAPDPMDTQIVLHISYDGTVHLSITAEILLDYPMPSFVGIPLKLNITGLSFDGVALIAYLRKRAHFCFLGPEDAQTLVGAPSSSGEGIGVGSSIVPDLLQEGADSSSSRRRKTTHMGGLLREIQVESEIGRKEGGKQVLKNVGKVEKFVLEQVRRIFEDEFVWPSFWTFLV